MLRQGGKTSQTPDSSRLAFLGEYRPMLYEKVSELTDNDHDATEWIVGNVLEKARRRYSSGPVPSDCSMALLADMYIAYSEYSGRKLQPRKPERPTARWDEDARGAGGTVGERGRQAAAKVAERRTYPQSESAERPLLKTTIGKPLESAPLMRRMSGITPPGSSGEYNSVSAQTEDHPFIRDDGDASASSKRRRRRSGRRTSVYAYYGMDDEQQTAREEERATTRAVPVYDIPEPVIPDPVIPEPSAEPPVIPIPPSDDLEDEELWEDEEPQQGPKTLIKRPRSEITKGKSKAKDAVYDENLTQFWSADDEDDSAEGKAVPKKREPEIEKVTLLDDKSSARSVPLTIINTILLLSLISAAVLLLFQLGLVPRIF